MGTRLEDTLAEMKALYAQGADDDALDAVVKKNGYTPERFMAAAERLRTSGEQAPDVRLPTAAQIPLNLANAALFNIPKKLAAAALVPGSDSYESKLLALQQEEEVSKRAYPKMGLATDVGGAVAQFLPAAKWLSTGGTAGQVVKNTAVGTGLGLAQGASETEGALDKSILGGLTGAAGGLAAVPLGHALGKGSQALNRQIQNRLFGKSIPPAADVAAVAKANKDFADALKADGYDETEILTRLNAVPNPSLMSIMDLVDKDSHTFRFVRDLVRKNRPGREEAISEIEGAAARSMADLPLDVTRRTGVQPAATTEQLDRFIAASKANAGTGFEKAYANKAAVTGPEVDAYLNDPFTQRVLLPRAKAYFAAERERGNKGWDFPEVTQQVPTGRMVLDKTTMSMVPEMTEVTTVTPTTQLLHTLKKVDTQIRKFESRQALGKPEADLLFANEVGGRQKGMYEAVDAARKFNPDFDAVMSKYAGDKEVEDAFVAGQKIFTERDPKEVLYRYNQMSAAEKTAYRAAAINEYNIKLEKIKDPKVDQAAAVAESKDMRKRIELLFGGDSKAFAEHLRYLDQQARLAETQKAIRQGSVVTGQEEGGLMAGTRMALGQAAAGSPAALAKQVAGGAIQKALTPSETIIANTVARHGAIARGQPQIQNVFDTLRQNENLAARRALIRSAIGGGTGAALRGYIGGLLGGN